MTIKVLITAPVRIGGVDYAVNQKVYLSDADAASIIGSGRGTRITDTTSAGGFVLDASSNVIGLEGPGGRLLALVNRYRAGRRLGNMLTKCPFGALKTSGFPQTDGANAYTSHLQQALETPYDAVRFVVLNNTAGAINNVIGKAATGYYGGLDPSGATANADGKTQNNGGTWSALTWGGNASVNLAAGASVHRPSYAVSDWLALKAADRLDAATQSALPLIYSRFAIPSADGVVDVPAWNYGTDIYGQNSYTGNWGNDVANVVTAHRVMRSITQNVDGVTTPANLTSNALTCGMPVIVQYATRRAGLSVMVVGDGVAEGSSPAETGSTTAAWSWVHAAAYGVSTPDFPIEVCNLGWSGETSAQYTQRLFDLLAVNDADGVPVFRPDILIYTPHTKNDGAPLQSVVDAQAANTARVLARCQAHNIIPILVTGVPNNAYNPNNDSYRKALNAQLVSMGVYSDYIVVDINGVVSDGAAAERWVSGFGCSNGTHPNDAGKAAAAQVLASVLQFIQGNK